MKSLRVLYVNRERLRPFIIQDMSYHYKKNDKIEAKTKNFHKKFCTKKMSPNQLNINLITKIKKKLLLTFWKVATFVNQNTPFIVIL